MTSMESESAEGAEQPSEARGDHLGFVAHEVRNPLSTALWSAELLARMTPEERAGARGDKLTAMCLRSLGRVRQLVEDHFLCERLDAHGIPVRPEPIPLRALLDEVMGRRTIELIAPEVDLPADIAVMADRILMDRALEAMVAVTGREGATVRVWARDDGGRVTIRISGAPLGAAALDDPKKGSQGDPKGRALALPMARRIAAALEGSLGVDGQSLVFTVHSVHEDQPGPQPLEETRDSRSPE